MTAEERRAAFLAGLAELAARTGFKVVGCDGCGCCASRDCPAAVDLGEVGGAFEVVEGAGSALEYRPHARVGPKR